MYDDSGVTPPGSESRYEIDGNALCLVYIRGVNLGFWPQYITPVGCSVQNPPKCQGFSRRVEVSFTVRNIQMNVSKLF